MKNILLLHTLLLYGFSLFSQPAWSFRSGESAAVHKDSSIIVAWATGCSVTRGFINIEDTTQTFTQGDSTSNRAFYGEPSNATGYPESNMSVVSLGDGGTALLTFEKPIADGPGYDFAVFENGFLSSEPPFDYYLELAFVEVSSDGVHFVRFPASTQVQDTLQIGTYGQINPDDIHNLAGKYPVDYGTPFDLADLKDSAGLNRDSIVYVRIVDVVGDINPAFASYDAMGNIINDPWPTPFWTGGFDLNGVGVIHEASPSGVTGSSANPNGLVIWPVPATEMLHLKTRNGTPLYSVTVTGLEGRTVYSTRPDGRSRVDVPLSYIAPGFYFVTAETEKGFITKTVVVSVH